MGRRTFESIGRALPGRDNLVLTRDAGFHAEGCRVFSRLDAALNAAGEGELMVIGGADIYAQTIALATRMHLTLIDANVPGDAYFPCFEPREWGVSFAQAFAAGPQRALGFRFVDYLRRS
jgi:dihydrofolate reductase